MGGRVLDRVLIWVVGHARLIPECVLRRMFMLAADCAWLLRVGGEAQLERNLAHVLASGHGRQTAGSATSVGRMGGGSDEASDRRAVRRLARAGMRSYFAYFSEALSVGARGNATLRARMGWNSCGMWCATPAGPRRSPCAIRATGIMRGSGEAPPWRL